MTEPTQTRDRLLDEAERLFAERGFEAVSIREIATASEANVAAVNYHFQGKENLYVAVLERRILPKRDRLLAAMERLEAEPPGRERLETLIRAFVTVHLDDALRSPAGARAMRLISREMSDPRHGASVVLHNLIAPVRARIHRVLSVELPGLARRDLQLLMGSIVGQTIYFAMNWHNVRAMSELHGREGPMPAIADDLETYIETVIDHVTRISLAGADTMRGNLA